MVIFPPRIHERISHSGNSNTNPCSSLLSRQTELYELYDMSASTSAVPTLFYSLGVQFLLESLPCRMLELTHIICYLGLSTLASSVSFNFAEHCSRFTCLSSTIFYYLFLFTSSLTSFNLYYPCCYAFVTLTCFLLSLLHSLCLYARIFSATVDSKKLKYF